MCARGRGAEGGLGKVRGGARGNARGTHSCLLLKKTLRGRHGNGEMAAGSADKPVSEQNFHPGAADLSIPLHISFVKPLKRPLM